MPRREEPSRKEGASCQRRTELDGSASLDLYKHFVHMTDEEIVHLSHCGNKQAVEYIMLKYKNFVRMKAYSYFLVGADKEDILQEGMIGLFKAIRDYQPDKRSSF